MLQKITFTLRIYTAGKWRWTNYDVPSDLKSCYLLNILHELVRSEADEVLVKSWKRPAHHISRNGSGTKSVGFFFSHQGKKIIIPSNERLKKSGITPNETCWMTGGLLFANASVKYKLQATFLHLSTGTSLYICSKSLHHHSSKNGWSY